jgi:hypothetical protein
MTSAYILVWLGPFAAQSAYQADLDSWANARWARLEPPRSEARARESYSDELVQSVEAELEQARVAAGSLDLPSMHKLLSNIDKTLRKHPELPQAAWLLAERYQIEANAIADANPLEAQKLDARARGLEGNRVPAFGAKVPEGTTPLATRELSLEGVPVDDRVYIDGVSVARTVKLTNGEHHARVLRRGRAVWSGWITIGTTTKSMVLPVPPPLACGRDDLGAPAVSGDRVQVKPGVLCSRWIAARPRAGGGIEVASCHHSWCGPLLPRTRRSGSIYEGPPQGQRKDEGGLPAWAGWLIAGAGAAAVTGVVLWRTGAFDGPEPGDEKWQFSAK